MVVSTLHREVFEPVAPVLRRAMRTRVMGVAGILAVLACGWWVTSSRIFELRNLHVAGNAHLAPGQIARLAGLSDTTNVFWFSSSRAERRLESSPWVLSARVSRTLPSEVSIVVREREPVAVVSEGVGPRLLVAADGTILGPAGRMRGLPLILTTVRQAGPRRWIDAHTPQLILASELPASARSVIASIDVGSDGQAALSLRGEVPVVFGDLTQVDAKGQSLVAVLSWAERKGVHPASIDVSVPGAPALVPAGAASTGAPAGH